MQDYHTLTVYLGSSGYAREIFKDAAITLGKKIGQSKKHLVYGGMDAGLMGLVASGALLEGGEVTGIIPEKIKDSERILAGLTDTILVDDLWDRKKRMFIMADAIIALPGGFGTLDEALEVLYWGNLALHNKPLVLVNIDGFWNDLIAYIKTCDDFDAAYLVVVDSVDEVFTALDNYSPPPAPKETLDHYPHFEDEITRNTDQPILVDKATIENSYYLICALGLKQLGKHSRSTGLLNTDNQFEHLLKWLNRAASEHFITDKCLKLFDVDTDETALRNILKSQEHITIDLHKDKWG